MSDKKSNKKLSLEDALALVHGSSNVEPEVMIEEQALAAAPSQTTPVGDALDRMKRTASEAGQISANGHLQAQMKMLEPYVQKVLLTAHEQAEQMLATQHEEADAVMSQARQKASDIIQKAHDDAEQIMAAKLERMAENIETIYAHADAIAKASGNPKKAYKLIDKFVAEMVASAEKAAEEMKD